MTRPPLTPFIRRTQATEPGTGLIAGILQARSPARHRNRRDNARQPLELPSYRTLQLQHSPTLSPAFGFTPAHESQIPSALQSRRLLRPGSRRD